MASDTRVVLDLDLCPPDIPHWQQQHHHRHHRQLQQSQQSQQSQQQQQPPRLALPEISHAPSCAGEVVYDGCKMHCVNHVKNPGWEVMGDGIELTMVSVGQAEHPHESNTVWQQHVHHPAEREGTDGLHAQEEIEVADADAWVHNRAISLACSEYF